MKKPGAASRCVIYLLCAFFLFGACADQEENNGITPPGVGGEGSKGDTRVTLSISAGHIHSNTISTRAPGEGTRADGGVDEYLDDLWILLYDTGGSLIEAYYTDRIYQDIESSPNTWVATIDMQTPYETECFIYCIGNTHDDTIFKGDAASTLEGLNQMGISLPGQDEVGSNNKTADAIMWNAPTGESRPGLLMRGVAVNAPAEGEPANNPLALDEIPVQPIILTENLEVMLYRMVTRIDFTLKNATKGKKYRVNIESIGLRNVPKKLGYMDTADKLAQSTYEYLDYPKLEIGTNLPDVNAEGAIEHTWYIPRHILQTHTVADPDVSTFIEVIGATKDEDGKPIRRAYRYFPNQMTNEGSNPEFDFNLNASQRFMMSAEIKGFKTSTLETNAFWSVEYLPSIGVELNADANCIIVRSDEMNREQFNSGSTYNFNIAPQLNKYGTYLATGSLAASDVKEEHATEVFAADAAWTAEIVWQTAPNLINLQGKTGTGPEGNISFTLSEEYTQGNALIAVKVNGNIVWSWHLWVLNHDPGVTAYKPNNTDVQESEKGKVYTFLNYNLGATTNTWGAGLPSYGLYYQWGRKDPFPNTGDLTYVADGYYDGNGEQYSIPVPYEPRGYVYLLQSVAHPDIFIPSTSDGGWMGSTAKGNSWDAIATGALSWGGYENDPDYRPYHLSYLEDKTVFDPCPAGYRIPPIAAFGSELGDSENRSDDKFNKGFDWTTISGGYQGLTTGPGIFPAVGGRVGEGYGSLGLQDLRGNYWSASLSDAMSIFLEFSHNVTDVRCQTYRSNGYSVRCISE